MEITRNFDPRRRLKGAAIAVQTVNYFSKKTHFKSKKQPFQTDNQQLIESKKVVFSDEVLNISQPSTTHELRHGSEGRLHFIESLTSGDLPLRHVSSPDIHSPTDQTQVRWISELVLNAVSEESVLPHQTKHGFSWANNKLKPVLRKRHDPSLPDNSFRLHKSCAAHESCEDGKDRKRKRSHGARVESKDGTPIDRFHVPKITQKDSLNLKQFIERDLILKPAVIGEGAMGSREANAHESVHNAFSDQTLDSASRKASDSSAENITNVTDLTQELKRLKMCLAAGANVAVEV